MRVVVVNWRKDGEIDIDDIKEKEEKNRDNIEELMIKYK